MSEHYTSCKSSDEYLALVCAQCGNIEPVAGSEDTEKSYLQEYQKVIAFDDLFKRLHAEIKEKLESYRYWGENPRIEFPPES